MSKSDVSVRLQEAALELFLRDGYDATTAAQIATQAGVTERTFFRYFADKREILFAAEDLVRDAIVAGIRDAPEGLSPVDMVFAAYDAFTPNLERRRGYAKPRQDLIAITPALRERELAKIAALADAASGALRARDIPPLQADLAAQIGMTAIAHATVEWLDNDSVSLVDRFRLVRAALKALV